MAQSYESVVSVDGGLLTGTAPSAGAPISYTLDTGQSTSKYGSQRLGPITAGQLSQISTQPFGTVNGVPVSLVEVAGKSITMPTSDVASLLAAIPSAITKVNNNISTSVKLATAPTPAPPPTPVPQGSTPKPVANTPDVPISIATLDPGPIKVSSPPLVIDALGLDGKPTGEKLVIDPPGTGIPDTTLDPAILSIIDTPPLVDTAEISAEIANIKIELPEIEAEPTYAEIYSAESQATEQDQANFKAKADWRVRLSLAPDSQYLYNDPQYAGILKPLKETDGVVFPYTPSITVNYAANYEATNIVHSNYKIYQYSGSAVEQVTIACDFTCQDTFEANYLLSVIHFFRSMTKMFYGQDTLPKNGTPPPLCYMFGMGGYQFAAHPLAISGFSYNLPADVDYIKTTSASPAGAPVANSADVSATRLAGTNVGKGGTGPGPKFNTGIGNETVSWVPTKIQLSITCLPIMSRNAISNQFSLRQYGSGDLVLGTRKLGGGMW